MITLNRFSDSISATLFAAVVVGICGYFFFAATQGPYGLYEKGRYEAIEAELQEKLSDLTDKRENAQNRVKRLSDDYLDLDLLDEQARKHLGFARTDEIIIR